LLCLLDFYVVFPSTKKSSKITYKEISKITIIPKELSSRLKDKN